MRAPVLKSRGRKAKVAGDSETPPRDRLLDATAALMIERGSIEVSLADIAKRTDLNSALISYYFGNKAGLMMALLRKVLGDDLAQLEQLSQLDISPQEKLRSHISGMIDSYFSYPFINPLTHQLVTDEPETYGPLIAEEFSTRAAAIQRRILEDGQAAGVFRKVDALHFYFHLVGACDQFFHGRYQMQHIFGIGTIDEAMKRGYSDYLADAIIKSLSPDA